MGVGSREGEGEESRPHLEDEGAILERTKARAEYGEELESGRVCALYTLA